MKLGAFRLVYSLISILILFTFLSNSAFAISGSTPGKLRSIEDKTLQECQQLGKGAYAATTSALGLSDKHAQTAARAGCMICILNSETVKENGLEYYVLGVWFDLINYSLCDVNGD